MFREKTTYEIMSENGLLNSVNSAETYSRLMEAQKEIAEQTALRMKEKENREKLLIQTNMEQIDLLKEQNKQLKEQCDYLKNLYETAKDEAKANADTAQQNAKDAMHNKIFGWVSFAVGTAIGIIGIIVGALI